jgi:hypothetical protein
MTVGKPPLMATSPRRPHAEMLWRVLLVQANLEARGNRWVRSAAYQALDSSEKSAVSYFLGNIQAKVTSELALGVPHLVHVDTVLACLGRPTRKSRPDFIGSDAWGRLRPVAIEAKGRTHGWTAELATRSKAQARRIPAILGLPDPLSVTSIAWFERDGTWRARLEDPPARKLRSPLDLDTVLIGYYWPIVQAMLSEDVSRAANVVAANFSEVDAALTLPAPIFDALAPYTERFPDRAAHAELGPYLRDQLRSSLDTEGWLLASAPRDASLVSTGMDLVTVELGDTWASGRRE